MPLVPNKLSVQSSTDAFQEGSPVIFDNEGNAQLGVILRFAGPKARVRTMRGREQDLPLSRLGLLPGALPSSTSDPSQWLLDLFQQANQESKAIPLDELWSFVKEEQQSYSTDQLAELYYGNNQLAIHLALRLALQRDRIYFKRKKNEFTPRSAEVVEELVVAEEKRIERENRLELAQNELLKRAQDSEHPIAPEAQPIIDLLVKVAAAAQNIEQSEQKEAKRVIDAVAEKLKVPMKGSREERAWHLLQRVALVHKNTNLAPLRNGVAETFSDAALSEAAALQPCPAYSQLSAEEREYRRDFTHLETITIDDPSTLDMDDALSIEKSSEGFQLGVHITDIASAISPDSVLDREAKSRATSVYLPEKTINMFPPEVADNKLSLQPREPRRTVSFLIDLDNTFQVTGFSIVPSIICVTGRLSYDSVEQDLKQPTGIIERLYLAAATYESERIAKGAVKVPKKDVSVTLTAPDDLARSEIVLEELDEQSPARNMVGELMILANQCVADYAVEHGLALVFRSQPPSDPVNQELLKSVPAGPALDYVMRTGLKRSAVSSSAAPHATLALKAYAQATSPIRRYTDLINQRQVLHHLRFGQALYSPQQIEQLVEETNSGLSRARVTTRESKRFWLYRVLEERAKEKQLIRATILRDDQRHYLIELDELYIPAYLKTTERLSRGDVVQLRIAAIDPKSEYLKLEFKEKAN